MNRWIFCCLAFIVLFSPGYFPASGLTQELEDRVVEHTLKNGMRVLILERHQTPIVSFNITYKVGGVNEYPGITGIAHLYEHMAFKGTRRIGTSDYKKEKKIFERMDRLVEKIQSEQAKGESGNPENIEKWQEAFKALQAKADQYVVPNEFSALYERQGGVGFNAGTGQEFTRYVVSLPSNRVDFWIAMEEQRMSQPVLREFYKERDVVMEERRRRYDARPMGKLYEHFLATAFVAHPYRLPVIGWASDISKLTRPQTRGFFETYYGPDNAVVAIVGDVEAEALIPRLEKTFGRIKTRSDIPRLTTKEPPQEGERRVEVLFDANPAVMIGYHKPDIHHPDDVVFDVIDLLLSKGRTSRLHRKIVQEKRLAVSIETISGIPGGKFTNLFMIQAVPRAPHTTGEVEAAIDEELRRLAEEPVEEKELQKIRNQLDAGLIRSLQSNSGMASQLAYFEALAGTWRYIIEARKAMERVTPEDVMRVAKSYFKKERRTVATLVRKETPVPFQSPSEEGS